MKDKLIYAAIILALITPFLLFFLTSWYYALIIGNIIYSVICGFYIRISDKEYSTTKSIIIPLIFNFLGFCYITLKIYEAKDKYRDIIRQRSKDLENRIYKEVEKFASSEDKKRWLEFYKSLPSSVAKRITSFGEDPDPEKHSKFKKFKNSVKSNLKTKEEVHISIDMYKWDTINIIEGDIPGYGGQEWNGNSYTIYADEHIKNACFSFDEGIQEFFDIINKYNSLDEVRGNDFNLLPDIDGGAHKENFRIEWDKPLSDKENKMFQDYLQDCGGVEELAYDIDDWVTDETLLGRIYSIEISIGDKENFKIEIL